MIVPGMIPPAIGARRLKGVPFTASGNWEPGLESWSLSTIQRAVAGSFGFSARSGTYVLLENAAGYADYVLPAALCGGTRITPDVWVRSGVSQTFTIEYSIAGAAFVTLCSLVLNSTAWTRLNPSALFFENLDLDDPVTIRLRKSTGSSGAFDDWSIVGTT